MEDELQKLLAEIDNHQKRSDRIEIIAIICILIAILLCGWFVVKECFWQPTVNGIHIITDPDGPEMKKIKREVFR